MIVRVLRELREGHLAPSNPGLQQQKQERTGRDGADLNRKEGKAGGAACTDSCFQEAHLFSLRQPLTPLIRYGDCDCHGEWGCEGTSL